MFNYIIDRKDTFFGHKNSIFQSPKKPFFPKGLTHAFVQIVYFFLYLFLVKIRPEIRLNTVRDRKETSFCPQKFNLSKSKKSHFSKGVNPGVQSKNVFFFLELFSVKIRVEIMFNNVLHSLLRRGSRCVSSSN